MKPEKKPTTSSKPNKPSKPSNDGNSVKPQKPSHTHKWVAVTKEVYHEATGHYEKVLVKKAWTEKIPIFETVPVEICNTCGADAQANVNIPAHVKKASAFLQEKIKVVIVLIDTEKSKLERR